MSFFSVAQEKPTFRDRFTSDETEHSRNQWTRAMERPVKSQESLVTELKLSLTVV